MPKFKLKAVDLKKLLKAITPLVEEGIFNLSSEGLSLRCMDPSHVAMVDFYLSKDFFEEYDCKENLKIGINLAEMLRLLKGVKSDDVIITSFDKETNKIILNILNKFRRTFTISTIRVLEEEVPKPTIDFAVKIRMSSTDLRRALYEASLVSDHVKFEASPEGFFIKALGDEASVSSEFPRETLYELSAKEKSTATFSLSYLSDMVENASKMTDVVTVEFSTDMPLKVHFELPKGFLIYYLAPRIEAR